MYRFTVNLSRGLYAQLKEKSQRDGVSIYSIIRNAIIFYLEENNERA